jgi:hypothetical protein
MLKPFPAYLEHKGKLVSTGTPGAYGTTSQTSSTSVYSIISSEKGLYNLELPDGFEVKTDKVYWIKKENQMLSFISLKQLLKIFPGDEDKLKEFIRQNSIKFDREEDVLRLLSFCGSLDR